ncbi:hypothetical protein [Komagataeibacter sp. FNDCR2]|uniref:hypothetical protein n=1 Tax=Komagataeibacter sp. FNDCR2 TaxID=2878682 RepID=UPI001E4DB40C|nr:hypothetical protein [Komagataeibacter sp. FNDCR2]MCE2576134.1 hypothetical protein [Komagataeibacter sp. FNDCR2]
MTRKPAIQVEDFLQPHQGLGVLRLATLLAEGECRAEDEDLDRMYGQMEAGALAATPASLMWLELARGLMAPAPATMLRTLRECGCLQEILPEVAGLFGVPQISDDLGETDLGTHMLATLAEAALRQAPLSVRFALLVMNVGKTDSPPEHLPHHYRHTERARPRIEALCARFGVPPECRTLALMASTDVERVHRVSPVRAGPVTDLLQQIGGFDAPALYDLLLQVCTCDYCAYGSRSGQDYPKAVLLEIARNACAGITPAQDADAQNTEAVREARAMAVAHAFRPLRWST